MIEPIGREPQVPPSGEDRNFQLSKNLHHSLGNLIEEIEHILANPQLLDNGQVMQQFSEAIKQLEAPSNDAIGSTDEDLHYTGEIVSNVITQPLEVPGARESISLLEAARRFEPENVANSDLRKVLLNFLQFPDETKTLIVNLENLRSDLI